MLTAHSIAFKQDKTTGNNGRSIGYGHAKIMHLTLGGYKLFELLLNLPVYFYLCRVC